MSVELNFTSWKWSVLTVDVIVVVEELRKFYLFFESSAADWSAAYILSKLDDSTSKIEYAVDYSTT